MSAAEFHVLPVKGGSIGKHKSSVHVPHEAGKCRGSC